MTPEELEAFRGWCRIYEMPPHSLIMRALEHIDQQAASLAVTEERVREHEAHENQTHAILGAILGTDDTLENVAKRAMCRIAELEAQVAALQEIAVEGRAYIMELERCMIGFMENNGSGISEAEAIDELALMKSERTRDDEARRQLAEGHPEAFG